MGKRPLIKEADNYKARLLNRALSEQINKIRNIVRRKNLDQTLKNEFNKKLFDLIDKRKQLKTEVDKVTIASSKEAIDLYINKTDKSLIDYISSQLKNNKRENVNKFFANLKDDENKDSNLFSYTNK